MIIKRFIRSWHLWAAFLLIVVSFRLSPVLATEVGEHAKSIEIVLQEVLAKQNVDVIQNLDCAKVSDEDLEHLGDAFMEEQHPGEAHEAMDRMMGGEGSETLRQMHINMGSAYLGCRGNYGHGMMGGMMGMMGFGNYDGMMNWGAGWGILGSLFFILVLIDLILLGIWLWKQIQNK